MKFFLFRYIWIIWLIFNIECAPHIRGVQSWRGRMPVGGGNLKFKVISPSLLSRTTQHPHTSKFPRQFNYILSTAPPFIIIDWFYACKSTLHCAHGSIRGPNSRTAPATACFLANHPANEPTNQPAFLPAFLYNWSSLGLRVKWLELNKGAEALNSPCGQAQ